MRWLTTMIVFGILLNGSMAGSSEPGEIFDVPVHEPECAGPNQELDRCRKDRVGPFQKAAWTVMPSNSNLPPVPELCLDLNGEAKTTGELPDPIQMHEQMCNRQNVELKTNLKNCVEHGINVKQNLDVDKACPQGGLIAVHEFHETENAVCELDRPKVLMDPGNGWFKTCAATGPGPPGEPSKDWWRWIEAKQGCCLVGSKNRDWPEEAAYYEFWNRQEMDQTGFFSAPDPWKEAFHAKVPQLDIYMCNPPDLGEDEARIHYYCAKTSQDIFLEGAKFPRENPQRIGPGMCSLISGTSVPDPGPVPDTSIQQFIRDAWTLFDNMSQPKGVVPWAPGQTEARVENACHTMKREFNNHCSDEKMVSTHQFAYSMGSLAASVWGVPFDFFGGGLQAFEYCKKDDKRPINCSIRNNCDPVPEVMRILAPYALYFGSWMPRKDAYNKSKRPYLICDEEKDVNTDCVEKLNARGPGNSPVNYRGWPKGPIDCGLPGGPPCTQRAWCGPWNPYGPKPVDKDTGRPGYVSTQCESDIKATIGAIYECLDITGETRVEVIVDCVAAAFHTYNSGMVTGEAWDDHAFDNASKTGGYRALTRPNWDVPRTGWWGSVAVPQDTPEEPGDCNDVLGQGPLNSECGTMP